VAAASAQRAFRAAHPCVHTGVAYLVECRTSSLDGALDADRVAEQVLESLQRSQVIREPGVALDLFARCLTMTARIEAAPTPQQAAVMAASELLWRTNQYCGELPVKITHLVAQLAGA
jgi:hypothetical protein